MLNPWLPVSEDSDFSLYNLPFGIFSEGNGTPRVGVAIGEYVIDMSKSFDLGLFAALDIYENVFAQRVLNPLIALGKPCLEEMRSILQKGLLNPESLLKHKADEILIPMSRTQMHMPLQVGDYTDFYSSEEHATTVGKLFRPEDPLFPNWKQMPVAYHGRASSIVVSGTPVIRPQGQIKKNALDAPVLAPSAALDYELELAFVIGKNSDMGKPVSLADAEEYVFGVMLFNDWSARDIQRWEYQPLGPFTSKNFASSVSPWVVTLEALEHCRVPGPMQFPEPLPYLSAEKTCGFDIHLSAMLKSADSGVLTVSQTNASHLYWTLSQQLAHHTITGCNLRIGDLLATGTVSGPEANGAGCLLEATQGGKVPLHLSNGEVRTFLEDGDEVVMEGYGYNGQARVGFGKLRGKIVKASG